MKTILALFVAAVFLLAVPVFAKYSGGSGTESNPWQISCPNDLLYLAGHTEDYNSCFILIADVNLADYTFTTAVIAPDTNSSNWSFDGTSFNGTFDGNNHIIGNLIIDTNGVGNDYLGLFGRTNLECEIKKLDLKDMKIRNGIDTFYAGGLVGQNYGIIINCHLSSEIEGEPYSFCFGGLTGENHGYIYNCYTSGYVTSLDVCGGLTGRNYGTITNCYSASEVAAFAVSGGLAGDNYGTINSCFAAGPVGGQEEIGGLAGYNENAGIIQNSYSSGLVTGGDYSGGLAGTSYGIISNCYATGKVTGSYCGGLIGYLAAPGTISKSFWDFESSGLADGVGNVEPDPQGAIFSSTFQMQIKSTFTGPPAYWDFVGETANGTEDIWRMCVDGVDYPKLAWEFINGRGDFVCPDVVNFADYLILAKAWLSTPADSNWNAKSDLYSDNIINTLDLKILIENWLTE